jgi:2-polyprenyl-3-methyl-5-hydroxy-6-metoxy-1,4-benzoquinol methylase
MNAKSALKTALLGSVDAITSRHTALLPLEAGDERLIFALEAPYRVDQPLLRINLCERRTGQLTATLVGYEGHFPRVCLWTSEPTSYDGPRTFEFDLQSGAIRLGDAEWGRAVPPTKRRFCWRFELKMPDGVAQRLTGHYRADTGRAIEKEYYYGEDYVDYAAQSAGEHETIARLFREFDAKGPVLEFGCATGGTLSALKRAGYEACGVDVSAWAVEQAAGALGPGQAFRCDAERDPLPADITARAPFGAVVMWAVLEHFREPFRMIEQLRDVTRQGSLLFINTTNADSLSHHVLGKQWEGYFDWSHHGVDQISVRSIRQELKRLGWNPIRLTTEMLWAADTDPLASTLRDWFAADARFRRLLTDKDLGDFITCVAVRQ